MLRLIKRPEVLHRTGISKSKLYDDIAKGLFPPPVSIGKNSVAWVESEIDSHIEKCIAVRDAKGVR